MPKIDFNTPFLDENGQPMQRAKIDKTKTKVALNGSLIPVAVTDADGNVQYENVMVKDVLAHVLNSNLEGDDKLGYDERLTRGKLVRKVSDSGNGSLKNYTTAQLQMIKDACMKAQAVPILVAQLEDMIEGTDAKDADKSFADPAGAAA